MIPPFVFHFSNICHVTTRKPRLPQCIMGDDLHINKQTNICIANHTCLLSTIHLSVFCRTNSSSTDQSRAEGNNTECVGKKRFNGRVLPMGFGKSMCYVPLFWTRYYIIFFPLWLSVIHYCLTNKYLYCQSYMPVKAEQLT
jgi:hypothetical protein